MRTKNSKMTIPKIGFSIGDINGVGLEVILKSLVKSNFSNYFIPVIYCSSSLIQDYKKSQGMDDNFFYFMKDEDSPKPKKINIFSCWKEDVHITFGEVNETGGKYAGISLDAALDAVKNKRIDALVTAPINKKSMEMSGFGFPGHTEFLTEKFPANNSLMLMVHDDLRIGVVTGHIALQDVAKSITKVAIIEKANILIQSLKMDFGIERPVIAILGLNPHAGDQGLFGDEEAKVIQPAMNELKKAGHLVMGPYPADGFFGSGQFKKFDAILAMYHDQGLIPFKTLAFGGGVNFTAGLPIVRTSPDHGTAFDIAGKNLASESSIRQATNLAMDISRDRKEFLTLTANKLTARKGKLDGEDEIITDME